MKTCCACKKPILEGYITKQRKYWHGRCYTDPVDTNNFMDTITICKLQREINDVIGYYKPCPKCKRENFQDPSLQFIFCSFCDYCGEN
ncbi:MAG: hypothetical protein AABZ60_20815 [Planctomycetota bacterium]